MTDTAGSWIEVQVELPTAAAELVAADLGELCGGVELRDAETVFPTAAGRTAVVALTSAAQLPEVLSVVEDVLATARAGGAVVDPVTIRQRPAHEDEWRDVWKQFFRTTRIGRRFVVRPSWDPTGGAGADRVIDLDPGRAFGTGAHPSTRLVIAAMEDLADRGVNVRRFLDLGCGSGILAIAASLSWPDSRGLALDIDPEAEACTRENLERNRVPAGRVVAATGALSDVVASEQARRDQANDQLFDLVMANIQRDVLERLAEDLARVLAPGGHLVLSGLLLEDAAPIASVYRSAGWQIDGEEQEGEWASLLLTRSAATTR